MKIANMFVVPDLLRIEIEGGCKTNFVLMTSPQVFLIAIWLPHHQL